MSDTPKDENEQASTDFTTAFLEFLTSFNINRGVLVYADGKEGRVKLLTLNTTDKTAVKVLLKAAQGVADDLFTPEDYTRVVVAAPSELFATLSKILQETMESEGGKEEGPTTTH